jgi:hypothetical protein
MPIIVIDTQYPHHKNKEVVETWLKTRGFIYTIGRNNG